MTEQTVQQEIKEAKPKGRFWTFVEVLNVRLRFIFLMVLVGLIAGHWDSIVNHYDRWTRPAKAPQDVQTQETEFYCPMHPNIVRSEPGSCPICGMPLSKRAKSGQSQLPPGVLAQVQLTPLKVRMGRIGTSPVGYRLLSREIRTVGIVEYDEPKRAFIASRVKGRIDELMVNYEGQQIKKGDALASIYSPDLVVAQEELLSAVRSLKEQQQASDLLRSQTQFLVTAARKKLSLWGITDVQIDEIIRRGRVDTHLIIYAPISGIVTEKNVLLGQYVDEGTRVYTIADLGTVWMQAKIFEDEIGGIKEGTAVQVTSTAYPGELFAGRITFIAYTVDPATRTVAARVEIANPDYKLKPGMYANALIRIPLGQVTSIAQTAGSTPSIEQDPPGKADTTRLAKAYLALTESYAKDTANPQALAQLLHEVKGLTGQAPTAAPASTLAEQVEKLQGKDLAGQRTLFKALSGQIIALLKNDPPPHMTLFTFHCAMADADWVAAAKEVRNPYYGKDMPTCGEMTGQITAKVVTEDQTTAVGYYCPIYPDRLFDKPRHCLIDKFPLKLVKVQKVLAVPESAVVDTGARTVVYRQTAPGDFDMVQVQVGPRAGEFYPVLSGLKPGDQVATVGAFLVDAENRLNPAASAQYFGASAGPQAHGEAHQHERKAN